MDKKKSFLMISGVLILIYSLWLLISSSFVYAQVNVDKTNPQRKNYRNDLNPQSENYKYKDLKDACEAEGGTWSIVSAMGPGACRKKYSDAGKPCTSSNQCQGDCVTNKVSELGKSGFCEEDNIKDGCETPVEEKYIECLSDDIMFRCPEQCGDLKNTLWFE
jgi:hypothetical protein